VSSSKAKQRAKIKKKLLAKQAGRCYYCMQKFKLVNLTFDHVVPKSKGGKGLRNNLVLACVGCNNKKGDSSLENFMRRIYDCGPL
jgi:5-methylcytosine-specific restriction endonuclease McrA